MNKFIIVEYENVEDEIENLFISFFKTKNITFETIVATDEIEFAQLDDIVNGKIKSEQFYSLTYKVDKNDKEDNIVTFEVIHKQFDFKTKEMYIFLKIDSWTLNSIMDEFIEDEICIYSNSYSL